MQIFRAESGGGGGGGQEQDLLLDLDWLAVLRASHGLQLPPQQAEQVGRMDEQQRRRQEQEEQGPAWLRIGLGNDKPPVWPRRARLGFPTDDEFDAEVERCRGGCPPCPFALLCAGGGAQRLSSALAMRCDAMRCDAMLCDAMLCCAMRCCAMRCDAVRCCALQVRDATSQGSLTFPPSQLLSPRHPDLCRLPRSTARPPRTARVCAHGALGRRARRAARAATAPAVAAAATRSTRQSPERRAPAEARAQAHSLGTGADVCGGRGPLCGW